MLTLIRFKTHEMEKSWDFLDEKLRDIVECLVEHIWVHFAVKTTITETFRDPRHEGDLHALGRAVDIRTRIFKPIEATEIRDWLNERVHYDPQRPWMFCAIYGDNDKSGNHNDHMHIQVHPRTELHFS